MTTDAKCPNCGAAVPAGPSGSDVMPGNTTSAVPEPMSCPSCGTRLTPDAQSEAIDEGGWHVDGERQA